jgi:hypothetical protein
MSFGGHGYPFCNVVEILTLHFSVSFLEARLRHATSVLLKAPKLQECSSALSNIVTRRQEQEVQLDGMENEKSQWVSHEKFVGVQVCT